MSQQNHERICRRALEEKFNKPFPKARPDFLINSEFEKSKCGITCYNAELKLAMDMPEIDTSNNENIDDSEDLWVALIPKSKFGTDESHYKLHCILLEKGFLSDKLRQELINIAGMPKIQ